MKRMIPFWLLLLALFCVFTGNVISEEEPYLPPPITGGSGGDDHPWGGDDSGPVDGGGKQNVTIQPLLTGITAIDFVYIIIKWEWINTRFDSRIQSYSPSRYEYKRDYYQYQYVRPDATKSRTESVNTGGAKSR